MWSVISRLVLRIAALRWLFKLGGLGLLLPLAFLLKVVGLPLLGILSVLALPVLVLLFIFGLPIFLVLIVGGVLMGLLGLALTIGVAALKFALFVVLPIWLVWAIMSRVWCWVRRKDGPDRDRPTPPPPPPAAEPFTEPQPDY